MFSLFIVFLLILLNALYVAAEFSAVGVRVSRINARAKEGSKLAVLLLPVLVDRGRLDTYIAACQIGITISSLVLGAYGQVAFGPGLTSNFSNWFDIDETAALSASAVVILSVLTVLQVVFGELVPKSLALQFPTRVALYTVVPMRWSVALFGILIRLLNGSGNVLLKIMGFPLSHHHHVHSPEEIGMIIAESREGGLLDEEGQFRLQGALRLQLRSAHQLMVHRKNITAVNIELPISQILRKLVECPYTRIPVYRDSLDNVVGILRTKDLVRRYSIDRSVGAIENLLIPPTFVPQSLSADRLLSLLRESGNHQAIVVNEHGSVVGLITLEDVLHEIFGATVDEFKSKDNNAFFILPDGRIRILGRALLVQVNERLGIPWSGTADTVSGFVIERLGRFPVDGERVMLDGVETLIEKMAGRVIGTVVITPPTTNANFQSEEN